MKAFEVNIHEAKTTLSKLLLRVQSGEDVVIARAGVPIARLVPMPSPRPPLGSLKGTYSVPDSFLDPLSETELKEWE